MALGTVPLPSISAASSPIPPDVAAVGPVVPPLVRLRIMSASTWEDLVLEWAHSLKARYARVDKCGGAGDMGRDIIAFESNAADDPWDNYQCKHYDHPLAPNDIWLELGKLAYYTLVGEYSIPRRYTFVAPHGVGNALSKLLRKPDELRMGLITAWERHCQRRITSRGEILLEGALRAHIASMDFTIFDALAPLRLIEEHAQTPWHIVRFGGGLPFRISVPPPPTTIAVSETTYVRALLDAYEDRVGSALPGPEALADPELGGHFSRSRREFYNAESLREFSRDNVPSGTFERLLDEVYDGVIDVVQANHADGYERVLAVATQAKALQPMASVLVTRITAADKGGMCHQLANDLRLRWRR